MSRIIYIDESCKAYVKNAIGRTAVEIDMLYGFADDYVEGFLVVPEGRIAVHPDGRTITGFAISPWKSSKSLDMIQRVYEHEQYNALLAEKAYYTDAYNEGVQEA